MKKISVVLPCHNEEKNLPLLIPEIIKNIGKKYDYEIICVDDGSSDSTSIAIEKICLKNKKVKGVLFYRNFGHQAALRAGLRASSGDAVITMDSDFQHPPELIKKLIKQWEKGYDLVRTQKNEYKAQGLFGVVSRKIGYFVWRSLTDGVITPGSSDFRLISRDVVNYLNKLPAKEIFLRGDVGLIARKPISVFYRVRARKHGRSSYTLSILIDFFLNGIVSFSTKPIRIATAMGVGIFFVAILFLLFDIGTAILFGKKIVEGWITVVIFSVLLNGMIMIYLGILGEYLGVIFREVKRRPRYVISKKINL